jgi:hypothetical protein|tara:strand:- start:1607 stop:1765 length:159 start_codon:yes stop_codon:yes gene_type:complete
MVTVKISEEERPFLIAIYLEAICSTRSGCRRQVYSSTVGVTSCIIEPDRTNE